MRTKQSLAIKATYWLKVVSLGLVLGLGLQFAQAWVAPTAAPPLGNVAGPITTGANQTKTGTLTTSGLAAPSFVDTDNAARYVNPSGTTSLWALNIASLGTCDLKTDASGAVYCGVDATAAAGGDNMGNHIATQAMNMNTNRIYGLAGGGGNSIGWGSSAGTGNGIYSDGANGNMAVRTSGTLYVQNQAGTGSANINTGYMYSSSTIDAHDYWIRAAGKWASQMGGGAGQVKAWLWWEGGLKASGNIASVVDSGNQAVVNFATPMPSASYAVVCNGSLTGSTSPVAAELAIYAYNRTTTSFYVEGMIPSGSDNIATMDCVVYGN